MKPENLCIYHANCADGLGAAVVVKLKMDLDYEECEFLPAHYGDEAPDVTGKNVFIVDFSYPRETLEKMHAQAESLLVIDHHKTAQAALEGLDYCVFDMGHSGAVLTWKKLFPEQNPPEFLRYIEDRDLWNWALPNSHEFSAGLQTLPMTVNLWALHFNSPSGVRDLWDAGASVMMYQDREIEKQVKRAYISKVAGYDVPTLNATHLISEIGNELANGYPFAALYFETEDKRIYSLRSSADGGIDVSEIAKRFGGGGHFHAAGFSIDKPSIQSLS